MQAPDWQKIYLNHSPKLLGICRRYVADLQTAEDLLQDSFILAMQKSHQLNDEKALFGWLKTIVVNNALQHLRKHSKEIFVTTEISEIPELLTEMNTLATENNHILAYDFTREELLKSIDSLPVHHRSVFNLYFIENNSHAEIAKLLGINVNTSKSHLMRAKKSVQNYLMTHFVNKNTPKNKKKMTQLLIFIGFGGLAWAQTFQSKFADFSILPSKELIIPNDIKTNSLSFSASSLNKNLQKKLIIAATLFIIILFSIHVNKGNYQFQNSKAKSLVNTKMIVNEKISENNFISQSKPEITEEVRANAINLNQKIQIQKTVSSENKVNEKATIVKPKDSIKNIPKRVVIVKKVIQRDTIFIEREN
ncbi:RNA polymerase sigma factor [Chryseobacterium chendengshani]|uniref:RNA polymerase sigma factor n=1 Tax=Chryseobacterium sp. LJ668 TaxID=2864040 RepID=UPI001C689447|nr:RNA polymerase sigma factor [Chryseobacterium sp. LJ668]MBW8523951.1 RNA polymerase sigma factor [Chryseobacterium sp. LJ668]QYK16891.1 RNA polymerase sigma factor [Chryseobacterium sp. LJ668]